MVSKSLEQNLALWHKFDMNKGQAWHLTEGIQKRALRKSHQWPLVRFSATFSHLTGKSHESSNFFPALAFLKVVTRGKRKKRNQIYKKKIPVTVMLHSFHPWSSEQEKSWKVWPKLDSLSWSLDVVLILEVRNGDSTQKREFELHARAGETLPCFKTAELLHPPSLMRTRWRSRRWPLSSRFKYNRIFIK